MGLIKTNITLRNALDDRLAPFTAEALVDTGALLLCLPEHVATQLKLPTLQQREATTADGRTNLCPYVGPIEVSFGNRSCFVGALVFGEEVLLGAVPMEDLDLVICPATGSVDVNPNSPNIPTAPVKGSVLHGADGDQRAASFDKCYRDIVRLLEDLCQRAQQAQH
jgi:clan AA aspartic protease